MIEELLAKFLGPQGMQQFMQFAQQQQAPGLLGPPGGGTGGVSQFDGQSPGASPAVPNMHLQASQGTTPSAMYPDDTGTYNDGTTPRTITAKRRK